MNFCIVYLYENIKITYRAIIVLLAEYLNFNNNKKKRMKLFLEIVFYHVL